MPAQKLVTQGEHDLLLEECFSRRRSSPATRMESEASAVLSRLPGNLTATVQLSTEEAAGEGRGAGVAQLTPLAGVLAERLAHRCRRRPRSAPRRSLPGDHVDLDVGRRYGDRALAAGGVPDVPEALLPPELRTTTRWGCRDATTVTWSGSAVGVSVVRALWARCG